MFIPEINRFIVPRSMDSDPAVLFDDIIVNELLFTPAVNITFLLLNDNPR